MHHDTLIVVLLSEHEPHHAARLKLYLLFKITSLYVAEYNMDFTFGLLFLIDGTSDKVCVYAYCSYFEWMMKTGRLWCGTRRQ